MAYPLFHWENSTPPPMVLSREEFRAEFPGEGDHVEFKQGISDDRVESALVAFSNADGGVILVGVAPDGSIHGHVLDGETVARLHRIAARVTNPGRYRMHEVLVGDRSVVAVSVARRHEGIAQTRTGSPLVRRGAMNTPLLGAELSEFVAKQALPRFDRTATDATLDDASAGLIARVASVWEWNRGNVVERMREHGLVSATTPPRLTVAGALYVLEDPERVLGKTFIEIFRYRDASNAYDKRVAVSGPVDEQVQRATDVVMDELGRDLVVLGVQRYELARIPERVLREAIANAVAHRSYEARGAAVRIEIRPDAVLVKSPGSLPEPVTVENIREQNAARNVSVIDTLRRYGLAEDAGRGIDVMEDTMQEQLLDRPTFADDGAFVTVTLPLGSTVAPSERAWITEMERRGDIRPADRVLLVHAARGEILTNQYARELLSVDSVDARSALQRLRDAGFLEQLGERGGAQYRLVDDLAPPAGLRLDPTELGDVVVGLTRDGPVTNAVVRERTGLDRAQALALLTALVEHGRLVRIGERRGARYVAPDQAPLDL